MVDAQNGVRIVPGPTVMFTGVHTPGSWRTLTICQYAWRVVHTKPPIQKNTGKMTLFQLFKETAQHRYI